MTSPRPRPTNTTPYPIQQLTHDPNSEIDLGEEDELVSSELVEPTQECTATGDGDGDGGGALAEVEPLCATCV